MMVLEGGRRRGGGLDVLMGKREEGIRGFNSERSIEKNLTRFLKSSLRDVRADPARRRPREVHDPMKGPPARVVGRQSPSPLDYQIRKGANKASLLARSYTVMFLQKGINPGLILLGKTVKLCQQ